VFSKEDVPLDAVLLMWSHLLQTNPEALDKIGEDVEPSVLSKGVWCISKAFIHLGLFSIREEDDTPFIKLHHQLYVIYGLSLVPEVLVMLKNTRDI
jgi:hypothetical protein